MSAENAPERRRHERRRDDDSRFWRALKGERRVSDRRRGLEQESTVEPTGRADTSPDTPANAHPAAETREPSPAPPVSPDEARRTALRNMLRAAEARQDRAGRARRPVLAKGRRVAIARGTLAGRAGTILDADYIDSRVLLRVDDHESPVWVPFSRVAATDEPGPPA